MDYIVFVAVAPVVSISLNFLCVFCSHGLSCVTCRRLCIVGGWMSGCVSTNQSAYAPHVWVVIDVGRVVSNSLLFPSQFCNTIAILFAIFHYPPSPPVNFDRCHCVEFFFQILGWLQTTWQYGQPRV